MPFRVANDAVNRTVGVCLDHRWAVQLVCRDCRNVGRLGGSVLAKYPRAAPLDAIAARAVCRCGGREGVLGLINEAGGASSRPMRPG